MCAAMNRKCIPMNENRSVACADSEKKIQIDTFLDSHLKNSDVKYRLTKTDRIATRWNA